MGRLRQFLAVLVATSFAMVFAIPGTAGAVLDPTDLTGSLEPADLAQQLAGAGVSISNVTFTGDERAAGQFTGGTGIIGFDEGVVLSTGQITDIVGPNEDDGVTTILEQPGDADLEALVTSFTFDATVLEFDFVPQGEEITFRYVFASDEYNEFVYAGVNDVFALFVNGVNCALVPDPAGGTTAVNIDTVNGGKPLGDANAVNSALYRNNDLDDGGGSIDTEMDGLTVVLTCEATVNEGVTNHMKLAIADVGDDVLDSNVFIEAGSIEVVNEPPTVDAGPDVNGVEGSAITLDGTVSDPDGDTLTTTWTYGAGVDVDAGATCTFANPNAVDTTVTCTDDGTYTLTLMANDGINDTVSDTTTLTLTNANPVVDITSPADGASFPPLQLVTIQATLTDAGENDTHTCSIDWGNGTVTDGTIVGGVCNGSLSYGIEGGYTITVTVTDDDGGIGTDSIGVQISDETPTNDPPTVDAGGNVAGSEGSPVNITGTATDPDGDPLTTTWSYTANLGVDAGTTCTFGDANALSTTVTCTDNGSFTLTLTASDGVNPPVQDTTALSLVNVAPSVTITTPSAGASLSTGISVTVEASFTDAGANDTHTCSINWGDGTTTAGTVAGGVCSGTHTYTSAGTPTIGVTVTDDDNGPGFASIGVTVIEPSFNQAPTADAGADVSGPEGSPIALDGTASDPDADPLTTTWSYAAGAGVDAGATCSFGDPSAVDTTITCTDDGEYTVTLTVNDGVNDPVADTATVTVTNVAPTVEITAPGAGATALVGAIVSVSATLTDAGANDTHTCTIDWGDGNVTDGVVTAGVCTGSHVYSSAGLRTIVVTATDDDGGSGTDSAAVTIEDEEPPPPPPGGAALISGGGFIGGPGPAGVSYGFEVRRDELGTITCAVQITKPGKGGWSFHSDTVTALVVDGDTATFSGTGRLNGTDGYTFEMTVRDLGTGNGPKNTGRDEVGIVIRDSSGAVVYSSGGPQPIGGGNVVVN